MQLNNRMRSLLAKVDLGGRSRSDLPPGFDRVVDAGWEREADGAWVLRALRESYHGPRSQFVDLTNYEAVVNGRGIPDYDIDPADPRREEILVRRSVSFVEAAFERLDDSAQVEIIAFATLAESWAEEPLLVANVTFWASRKNEEPYMKVDADDQETAMMSLSSLDDITL